MVSVFENFVDFQNLSKITNSQTAEVKGSRRLKVYINVQENKTYSGRKWHRENHRIRNECIFNAAFSSAQNSAELSMASGLLKEPGQSSLCSS